MDDVTDTDEASAALSRAPEILHIALGAWLFISAFVWPHYDAEQTNAWVVALFVIGVSLFAMIFSWLRRVNAAIAIWLFATALLLPAESPATKWNGICLAVAILSVALAPSSLVRAALHLLKRDVM